MIAEKPAISTTLSAVAIVAIVVVAGVAYYAYSTGSQGGTGTITSTSSSTSSLIIPTTSSTTSFSSSTSTSTTRSLSSSSTTTTTTSAPTSSTTTSTTTTSSTTSSLTKGSGIFIATFSPATPTLASDVLVNYTLSIQILGGSASSLTVAVTGPAGLSVAVSPAQITVGSGPGSTEVTVSMRPAATMATGTYPVTVTATGGGAQYTSSLAVKVVSYLVVTIEATFIPQLVVVPMGSTVTWLRLNGPIGQDGHDDGTHNVDLNPGGISAVSPNLAQYDSWTYTYTKAGSFGYVCDLHPANMVGSVKVTP